MKHAVVLICILWIRLFGADFVVMCFSTFLMKMTTADKREREVTVGRPTYWQN
jgi:hypothetical protein